jgi:hypothetical protein
MGFEKWRGDIPCGTTQSYSHLCGQYHGLKCIQDCENWQRIFKLENFQGIFLKLIDNLN